MAAPESLSRVSSRDLAREGLKSIDCHIATKRMGAVKTLRSVKPVYYLRRLSLTTQPPCSRLKHMLTHPAAPAPAP